MRKSDREVQTTYSASDTRTWTNEAIRAIFGAGEVHYCTGDGPWDVKRLAETFHDKLLRSWYSLRDDAELGNGYWYDLCIRLDEKLLVRVDRDSIGVYATSPEKARATIEQLRRIYRQAPEPEHPTFQIVKQSDGSIDTESVRIGEGGFLDDEALALNYGEEFVSWNTEFVGALRRVPRGLSVFDGPPGTGKTSYLRHLMVQLKNTHRFYFIASANLKLLRDAEFVDFWSSERRMYEDSSMVVILEDSENALMPRSWDNQQEVSLLLSITDGILGEFLKLQVICTINCDVKELDSALLRPGRLMARRHFGRLNPEQAGKLAARIGRVLPPADDYSLAEVFAGRVETPSGKTKIGFGI